MISGFQYIEEHLRELEALPQDDPWRQRLEAEIASLRANPDCGIFEFTGGEHIAWKSGELIGINCACCAVTLPVISRRIAQIGRLELFQTAGKRLLLAINNHGQHKIIAAL